MAERLVNFQREKKKKQKLHLATVVAEAEYLLASKKKKKKPHITVFSRNPFTGKRSKYSKYRRRKNRPSSTTTAVPASPIAHDVDFFDGPTEDLEDLYTDNFSDDLDQPIEECATYTKPPTIRKSWTTRIEDLGKSWANKRLQIRKSLLELEPLLPSAPCVPCKKDQSLVRCRQCGSKEIMCAKCDNDVHRRNPFHDREIYHEGFFKPEAPSVSSDGEGNLTTVVRCLPHSVNSVYNIIMCCMQGC